MNEKTKRLSSVCAVGAALTLAAGLFSFSRGGARQAAAEEETASPVVSVVNFEAVYGDKAANVEAMGEIVAKAAEESVNILVFPEMATTGYVSDGDVALALAEGKTGATAAYFASLAKENGMYIVYGGIETAEGDDSHAYSSSFVVTPDGKVDSYQKILTELPWEKAGSAPKYFDTEFGKVALSAGNDAYMLVEITRAYAATEDLFMIAGSASVETAYYPENYNFSNYVYDAYTQSYQYYDWTDYNRNMAYNTAYLAGIYVATANLVGDYDGVSFAGGSSIVGETDAATSGKIWSMWRNLFDQDVDLTNYLVKTYAGSFDGTDTLNTAALDLSCASHSLVLHQGLYNPEVYAREFASLAERGSDLSAAATASDNPVCAVVNMAPALGDMDANLATMLRYIDEAHAEGVNVLVFPEMALGGYVSYYGTDVNSAQWQTVLNTSITVTSSYAQEILEKAEEYGMFIVYGTAEVNPADEFHPYNSAFIATPTEGTLTYRKIQPVEGDWCTAGDFFLIVDTPWGGMGVSICMDTYAYPEMAQYYANAGCTMIVNPTASGGYAGSNFIYNSTLSCIVGRGGLAMLSADLVNVGENDTTRYPGKSTIIEYNGMSPVFLTEESMTEERMYIATVDLSHSGNGIAGYNASLVADVYEKLANGNALYDYSGLIDAAPYETEGGVSPAGIAVAAVLGCAVLAGFVVAGVLIGRKKAAD